MWKTKSCPRCGGDMFLSSDFYGYYEQCLQCSYMHELKDIAEFKKEPIPGKQKPVHARGTIVKRRASVLS